MAEQFSNNAQTTLSEQVVDGSDNHIHITSEAGFPTGPQFRVIVDNEIMLVTGGVGTGVWSVTRGVEGTTAVHHDGGAAVTHVLTAGSLVQAIEDRTASAVHVDVAGEIAALTEKVSPVAADLLLIEDSEASNAKKKVQIGNLPGAASAGFSIWCPDAPPVSPHAMDDEFNDNTVSANWTEWDVPNRLTVSEDSYGLLLAYQTSVSGNQAAGVYKAKPQGDFAMVTHMSWVSRLSNYSNAGLLLGNDLANNPATSGFLVFQLQHNVNQCTVEIVRYNNYASWGEAYRASTYPAAWAAAYLRIRMVSNVAYYEISPDGVGWIRVYSATPPFSIGQVGLFIENQNTDMTAYARFRFFRVTTNVDFSAPVYGRRVRMSFAS